MSTTEENIQPTIQPGGTTPASGPDAPTTAAPTPPPEPPKPEDRRAVVEHAFRNPRGQHAQRQPRNDVGQFAGAPAPPEPSRPQMPASLKQHLKEHWEKAPVELLNDIIRRDADYESHARNLSQSKAEYEKLLNEFKPYESMLKAENATPQQVIGSLMQTAAVLRTGSPAQKAYAVAQTMRQFGIDIGHVTQLLNQAPASTGPYFGSNALLQQAIDPQISQLTLQVQQLTELQQKQTEARAMAAIEQFAADPAHKHFEAVSERMSLLLQNPQVMGPNAESLTERERLKLAYDTAIRMDPAIYQQVLAEEQTAQRAKQQVAQARQAAVQVTGAPAPGPPQQVDPKDRRAVIANAFRAAR